MELPIIVQGEVGDKTTNIGKDRNGIDQTYYNVKLIDRERCENMPLGVPKEVFDKCEKGKVVRLGGYIGGLKNKYFKITEYIGVVNDKT